MIKATSIDIWLLSTGFEFRCMKCKVSGPALIDNVEGYDTLVPLTTWKQIQSGPRGFRALCETCNTQ